MAKELVVTAKQESGFAVMRHYRNQFSLGRLVFLMANTSKPKNILLNYDSLATFKAMQIPLGVNVYDDYWVYVRHEVAKGPGSDIQPVISTQNLQDEAFSGRVRFIFSWTQHDKAFQNYTNKAILEMQEVLKRTQINAPRERVVVIEGDAVLLSNTKGFQSLFPTVSWLQIRSDDTYDDVKTVIKLYYLMELIKGYGKDKTLMDVSDDQLRNAILGYKSHSSPQLQADLVIILSVLSSYLILICK